MSHNEAGDAWFRKLPVDWDVAPLRFLARFESGGTPDKGNRDYWDGDIPWVSPKDMKVDRISDAEDHISEQALRETSVSMIPPGSILLVVRGMILAHSIPVATTEAPVTINQDMKALSCNRQVLPDYLQAVIQGAKPWFLANTGESSHGTKKLETEVVGRFLVPLPPMAVQSAIADFLDTETARIDALIKAKEDLLAILAEKRRAVITQAVTRGLDSNAPVRDSGIQWLGEIPAHWEVTRLKFLLDGIEQGWSPQCYNYPAEQDEWAVLKSGCCNGGIFREGENKSLPTELEPPGHLEVQAGDVLMSRASGSIDLLGAAARVPINVRARLLFSDLLYRLRVRKLLLHPDHLVTVLVSEMGRAQVRMAITSTGGLANKLPQSAVAEFLILTPSLAEQEAIVRHVNAEVSAIDKMSLAEQSTIDLLRERREAVIASAVTGQLPLESPSSQETAP